MSTPDLSALVAARLCHDLISPIGAVSNGLELLEMSAASNGPELALVNDSVATALAKLRFYRLAFGPADALARISFEEAAAITGAKFQGRFTVAWDVDAPDLGRPLVRLIYLAILCMERSLPMGGQVRVAIADGGIGLSVEGRRTAPPPDLWAHVTRGAAVPDLRADGVQFPLLARALTATGHRIEASFSETEAALTMTAESAMLV